MDLSITPTKLCGGVLIEGDSSTLRMVERLLTRTAIESHACDDSGICMTLSRYFEQNGRTVDWVTLFAGVSALRNSMGFRLSRKDHALICTLEFLVHEALIKLLPKAESQIDNLLDSMYGFHDLLHGGACESRMVYLYLLKTPGKRKSELLKILSSLSPVFRHTYAAYSVQFEGLHRDMLTYPSGEKFKYPLQEIADGKEEQWLMALQI